MRDGPFTSMSEIPDGRWDRVFGGKQERRSMQPTGEVVGTMTVNRSEEGGRRVFSATSEARPMSVESAGNLGPYGPLPDPDKLTIASNVGHDHHHGITEMVGHLMEHGDGKYTPEQARRLAQDCAIRKDLHEQGASAEEKEARAPMHNVNGGNDGD